MSTNITNIMKRILSGLMAAGMAISLIPSVTYAAQSNEYVDPADVWIESNGRTNELDINATTTYETIYCPVCDIETTQLIYRVPEYTKSGETALNRGVVFSDGKTGDGKGTGNLDSGTPGVNAYYSGSHWTKSVCQKCGTINSVDGLGSYACGKNVYILNPCDNNFFLDFDNTTYTPYDSRYHTTVLKKGEYCQFCKGTYARATEKKETHNFDETIDGELGNQRFHVTGNCEECGYIKNEYVAAKSVIQSYYGKVDGNAHTILVSDLSEDGVNTSIRYGTEAGRCNKTSAPNYTDEGYYPIYYEVTYSYSGENMTENGVSYVWLIEDNSNSNMNTAEIPHVHDYRYFETVLPTCTELGYDRFQCSGCGTLQKTNYVPANGHDYDTVVIREASCTQGGLELHMCKDCGSHYTESTSITNHKYQTSIVPATCTMNGYTEHKCIDCGYKYITDLTPLAKHDYREKVTAPTCKVKGYTTYTCNNCGDIYISDYTEPTGHEWDEGHIITNSTCENEGVMEYDCKRCDESMIKATSSKGHIYGDDATCTEPQTCTVCGAVLNLPTGHHYLETVTIPTCTSIGYTTFTCDDCGVSYIGNYTDKAEHHYHGEVTYPTCTELGYTTYTCTECGDSYKSDYKDKKLHSYKAVVTPPTCTAMGFTTYTCENCGDSYVADYTDVLQHNYTKQVIEPTCTELGYTIYKCPDCGKEYIGDEKESIKHHYNSVITEPTCEEMGFTTYTCEDCGYSYAADYTDAKGHNYKETITEPTCTDIGFSTFICKDCRTSYIGNEKAKLPHNYDKAVIAPTCTEMGYTVFNCKDCGDTYTGDYADANGHSYKETITEPTCTEIGFSTFTCKDCGTSYIGNETAKTAHNYEKIVTAPTCLDLGFTTYTCIDCGESHKSDYIEAAGHKLSDWIIDAPATIEDAGSKHIECTVCGEALETAEIPQLIDKDNSDEDGHSKVGDYNILITDKDNKPIFNSEISIDKNDNITIKLPDGRLLSAEDITTITVTNSETQQPAVDIHIFISDTAGNAATGRTDANGLLSVPNKQSSTGNTNGAVTDNINTYVVVATDKNGELIPNCDVTVGENYSIDVTLPTGTAFNKDNRITVTVVTEKGEPVSGLRVQLIGDGDYIENGYTNIKGQITLPMSNTDITDDNGSGEVGGIIGDKIYDYIVTVSDETGLIKNALITLIADDDSVLVCLPEGKVIDYFNRTTVKVVRSDGTPVEGWKVSVYNKDGSGLRTELTDENGIVIVPPLSEAPISKPTPVPNPGAEVTPLPGVEETPEPEETENPSATDKPTDTPDSPEMPSATNKPSEPTSKPEPIETPDIGDGAVVQNKNYKYRVFVWDNDGAITDFGLVKLQDNGDLSIELPSSKTLIIDNRVNIKVVNEEDKTPVKGITVNVTDVAGGDDSDITNSNGIAVVPVSDTDITDSAGNAQIKDNNGNLYNVVIEDTKAKIENAYVEIKDGKISIKLPDTSELTTSNQTTVTVTDKDAQPVKDMSVTVTDKNSKTAVQSTNARGKITVPVKTSSGGGGSSSGGSSGGGGGRTVSTVNVKVTDKDGKSVSVTKSTSTNGITLTLPNGITLDGSNYYTITVTDSKGSAKTDYSVTLKDKSGNTASGVTDANGQLILPAEEHKLYIVGYDDGEFKPENNMTRAEVAAIFARNIAERKGENISNTKSSFTDVDTKLWYNRYIGYLEKYDIIEGYNEGTFKPEKQITRAEFVTMCTKFYNLFDTVTSSKKNIFNDVINSHWASGFIYSAVAMEWIKGYADSTFKPDSNITRAEVVAIVNRVLDRSADTEYVNKNISAVNKFTDLKDKSYWVFYDVIEAANTHMAVKLAGSEIWVK